MRKSEKTLPGTILGVLIFAMLAIAPDSTLAQSTHRPVLDTFDMGTAAITAMQKDSEGNLYLGGYFDKTFSINGETFTANPGISRGVIIKLDSLRNVVWKVIYNEGGTPSKVNDLLVYNSAIYVTGVLNERLMLQKRSITDGQLVNGDLSHDVRGNTINSEGLKVTLRAGNIIFTGYFEGSDFNMTADGSPNDLFSTDLQPAGPDDFFVALVDSGFTKVSMDSTNIGVSLPVLQFGNQSIAEHKDRVKQSLGPAGAFIAYETEDDSSYIGSSSFAKNVSNIRDSYVFHTFYSSDSLQASSPYHVQLYDDNSIDLMLSRVSGQGVNIMVNNRFFRFDINLANIGTVQLANGTTGNTVDLNFIGGYADPALTDQYYLLVTANQEGFVQSDPIATRLDNGLDNLYVIYLNNNSVHDIDNLGEVDMTDDFGIIIADPGKLKPYIVAGSIARDTTLLLGREYLSEDLSNHYQFLLEYPDSYFEFLEPNETTFSSQFLPDTITYVAEDVTFSGVVFEKEGTGIVSAVTTTTLNGVQEIWAKPDSLFGNLTLSKAGYDSTSYTITAAGQLTLSKSTNNFGTVLNNRVRFDTLTVENTGDASLTISSAALRGNPEFSVVRNFASLETPAPLNSGATDTLVIRYESQTTTEVTRDTLDIVHTGVNTVVEYSVYALGLAINADAQFNSDTTGVGLSTTPLNYFAGVDTQLGQSDTLTTYIINTGTDSLRLSILEFSDPAFRLTDSTPTSFVLPPTPETTSFAARSAKLEIIFEPEEWRSYLDTLYIQSNDSAFADGLINLKFTPDGIDTLGRIQTQNLAFAGPVYSENDSTGINTSFTNTGVKDMTVNSVSFNRNIYFTDLQLPLELTTGASQSFALSVETNFYNIPQDTTLIDTMTINHTGSTGQSKYLLTLKLTRSKPIIQFDQTNFSTYTYNYAEGQVDVNLGQIPIQDFRTERIEFYNIGQDTMTYSGTLLLKGLNNTNDEVAEIEISDGAKILAPGDTGFVSLNYELFKFEPFAFSVEIFTDAEQVKYETFNNSALSTADSDNGDFKYIYSGETSVPFKTVVMTELLTDTLHPSFVNILLQATDNAGVGMTFLDQNNPNDQNPDGTGFFSVTENGNTVDPNAAEQDFRIFKQDAIDFEINTALVLDMSTSIPLQDLPKIKEGAKNLVRNLEENQQMAIYIFSDIVEEKISFTSDTTALISVIDGLQRTGSSTNLFGAVIDAANDLNPLTLSTREKIARGNIVVFTDGAHNANNLTSSNVNSVTSDLDVYAVGVGSANTTELQAITGFSGRVFSAADFDALNTEFRKVQREIAKTADSFYVLSYISPSRATSSVPLAVTVDSPLSGQSLSTNFSSVGFSSLFSQVVVNQNFPELLGVDTVFVPANLGKDVFASTILNAATPTYKWKSSNPAVVSIQDDDPSDNIGRLIPEGLEGEFTMVTVTDTSNFNLAGTEFLSKTFTVVLGAEVDIPVFSLSIISGQTGTFQLGETGVQLTILSNSGDNFTITADSGPDTPGTLPVGVDSVFAEDILTITATSSGTIDISYAIQGDLKDYPEFDISLFTVLKRDDNSSAWVDLSLDPNLTITISNDSLITVSGLTSFSQFALGLKDQQSVSNEEEGPGGLPARFTLSQNYPNPFNPTTTIQFGLPKASNIRIELFNVLGQQVMVVAEGRYAAGWHQINLNGAGLSSGMYIYRLVTPGYVNSKKLMLIK